MTIEYTHHMQFRGAVRSTPLQPITIEHPRHMQRGAVRSIPVTVKYTHHMQRDAVR